MITGIRHRGLRRLFEQADGRDVPTALLQRIKRALFILETATSVRDIARLPGMRVHALKGDLAGFWSVSISGNWRIIFRFADGEVFDVDLVDYH
jgi:proteic killer suppression protein